MASLFHGLLLALQAPLAELRKVHLTSQEQTHAKLCCRGGASSHRRAVSLRATAVASRNAAPGIRRGHPHAAGVWPRGEHTPILLWQP